MILSRIMPTYLRLYGNCTIWRFIRSRLIFKHWRRWWKKSIEQKIRIKNSETRKGNYEPNANWQCSERDNCNARDYIDKRAKTTQLNLSPRSFTPRNESTASPKVLILRVRKRIQTVGLMKTLAKNSKEMWQSAVACWKLHTNWVGCVKIWSRRRLHRF